MKKLSLIIIALMACISMQAAQSAADAFSAMARKLKAQKSIVAQYVMTADGQTQRGTLTVAGSRFTIHSPQVSVWYNGKSQWTYSPQMGEVNLTEPSADELAQINPFGILSAVNNNYNISYQGKKIKLTAKASNAEVRSILVGINSTTKLPTDIVITLSSGQKISITISTIKDGGAMKADSFTFHVSQVPRGVKVVDLR